MNEMMFCKKCKRFRAHFDYEEHYQCVGCKSTISKIIVPIPKKLGKRAQDALNAQQYINLRRVARKNENNI